MNRIIVAVAILILTAPLALIFVKRGSAPSGAAPESFMESVQVVNKASGKHRWTLHAEKVRLPSDGNSSFMSKVAITLPEQGMEVTSDSGLYDLASRDLTLKGNIEAMTEDYKVRTDSVYMDSSTGELSTKDAVVLEGRNFRVEGEGFRASGDKRVTFKRNVKATFF